MTGQKNVRFLIGTIVYGLAVAATDTHAAEMRNDNYDVTGNNWGVITTADPDSEDEIKAEVQKVYPSVQILEQTPVEQKAVNGKDFADKVQELGLGNVENQLQEFIQILQTARDILPILDHILNLQEYTQEEKNTIFHIAKEAEDRRKEGEKSVDDKIKLLHLTVAQFMKD